MTELRSRWIIASGEIVTIGDQVALDLSPDSYGRIIGSNDYAVPTVEVIEGNGTGKTLVVSPGQMLSKRLPRPTDNRDPRLGATKIAPGVPQYTPSVSVGSVGYGSGPPNEQPTHAHR